MKLPCRMLIQAVGRLIRTEQDTGAVTILDTRIKFKKYGQNILNFFVA
ncbi:helicase C-terminal domain-containing protein [Photorhabdus bodei]